ncbi:hypothetical protein ACWDUN_25590 [Mycobacterium sp. NPDC003323]
MRVLNIVTVPALVIAGLTVAPEAAADCTSSGGTTICSQGEVRGSDTGNGPSGSSGPYVPYACGDDWYTCDNYYWGIDVDLNPDFDRPGRPQIGGPGGPGGPDIGRGGGRGGGRR